MQGVCHELHIVAITMGRQVTRCCCVGGPAVCTPVAVVRGVFPSPGFPEDMVLLEARSAPEDGMAALWRSDDAGVTWQPVGTEALGP